MLRNLVEPVILVALIATVSWAAPPHPADLVNEAAKTARFATDPETRALCLAEVAVARHDLGQTEEATEAVEEAVACALAAPNQMAKALSLRTIALRLQRMDSTRAQRLLADAAREAQDLKYAAERAVALREIAVAGLKLGVADAPTLVQQALESARKVDTGVFRGACLRDLAAGVAPYNAPLAETTFAEARDAMTTPGPDDGGRALAQAELAGTWAPSNLAAAQAVADSIAGAMGWDKASGAPTKATYRKVGMADISQWMEAKGFLPA